MTTATLTAKDLGRRAHRKGIAAPAQDKYFMARLTERFGDSTDNSAARQAEIREWLLGWDTANLSTDSKTDRIDIRLASISYSVKVGRGKTMRVEVDTAGKYGCPCPSFELYGECKHIDALKAHRQAEGRRF